jgi:hypothetical protein
MAKEGQKGLLNYAPSMSQAGLRRSAKVPYSRSDILAPPNNTKTSTKSIIYLRDPSARTKSMHSDKMQTAIKSNKIKVLI